MQSVGTFYALDIGSSGLAAAQIAQNITGNNISNADTPGYSDETPDFAEGIPYPSPDGNAAGQVGQLGSGVSVSSISRASNKYLDAQVRDSNSSASSLSAQNNWLSSVQTAFNEPGSNTINTALGDFFNSFASIQNNPESTGVKETAVQAGDAVAQQIQSSQSQLDSANGEITTAISDDMKTVNSDGQQIASLNTEIRKATIQGLQPNQLLDQRDSILDSLSQLANITVSTNADSTVNVAIGTSDLVVGTDNYTTSLSTLQSRGDLTSGELSGLTQSQTNLNGYQTQLDQLASQLITSVNAVHSTGTAADGSTGLNFFTGTSANDIAVNPTLLANPEKLAVAGATTPAGTAPASGDAANATAILALQNTNLTTGPLAGQTFQGFYTSLVTQIGSQAADAGSNLKTAQASQTQLTSQRASITGVNQDSELTNMIKYQRMYQAAAKVITTQDSMLDSLMSMVQ